jgi:hypothetical protein
MEGLPVNIGTRYCPGFLVSRNDAMSFFIGYAQHIKTISRRSGLPKHKNDGAARG